MVKVTVSFSLCAMISPPCRLIISLAIERPRPTPPVSERPLKNILFFNIEFLMHAKNPPVLNGLMDFL